jgi:SET domain-containing protein
MNLFIFVV